MLTDTIAATIETLLTLIKNIISTLQLNKYLFTHNSSTATSLTYMCHV